MTPIFWLETADEDLAAITEYIGLQNMQAAERMWYLLRSKVLLLSDNPYRSPIGRVAGTYELVAHANYVIVYRVTSIGIEIINIQHSRQKYPKS